MVYKLTRYVNSALLLLLLSGCTPAPPALIQHQDYQQRLGNVIGPESQQEVVPERAALSLSQYPSVGDFDQPLVDLRMSLLTSWSLSTCSVGATIAHRNSSLGRLEQGLLRYHTDRLLAQQLRQCAQQMESTDPELAQQLAQFADSKQQSLTTARQFALVTDTAIRHSFTPKSPSLATVDNEQFAISVAALQVVMELLQAAQPPSRERLLDALQTLEQSTYLAQFWQSLAELNQALPQSTAIVAMANNAAACSAKGTTDEARILKTIFSKYFAAQLQPQIAHLSGQGFVLTELLQSLPQQLTWPPLQQHFLQLLQQPKQLRDLIKQEAQQWQQFFQACGFKPGGRAR